MMLQKVLKSGLMFAAVVWLAGCSSAAFPEVIEDDSMAAAESGNTVLKEGNSLSSDADNAAYEDMPDEEYLCCPTCGDILTDRIPDDNKNFYFHCLNCGQKFDWREDDTK